MGIPGSANPMLFGGAAAYQINQSLRFDGSSYLSWTDNITPDPVARDLWTLSVWIKRGALGGSNQTFFSAYQNDNNRTRVSFYSSDLLNAEERGAGASKEETTTNNVFRDPSAWFHLVYLYDVNAPGGSGDYIQFWINGVRASEVNAARVDDWAGVVGDNGTTHNIGRVLTSSPTDYFNGYLAEMHLCPGLRNSPSDYGESDPITGAWIPKRYTGTYGTHGYYLKFDPSATNGIGHDHSGNGNNFTATGFSTSGTGTDVMSDTPTNNYATLNPINRNNNAYLPTMSNGNLEAASAGIATHIWGTMAVPSSAGSWYWEGSSTLIDIDRAYIGIIDSTGTSTSPVASYEFIDKAILYANGNYFNTASGTGGTSPSGTFTSYAQNDVIMVAYSNGKIWFGKNGTWMNSGNPAAGTGAVDTGVSTSKTWLPYFGYNSTWVVNFGQRAFAYTPPTGFKALNTANLPEPTIKKGSKYFDTKLFTAGTTTVTGYEFQPDLVWVKNRNQAYDHRLIDAVRGVQKDLSSNLTNAEQNRSNSLLTFTSDGFTHGSFGSGSGDAFVGWAWDANGAGSSNTAGSITSTVSANATAGFSIVTYTGNGTAGATVGHGLGVAPKMIIAKIRTQDSDGNNKNWNIYHAGVDASSPQNYVMFFTTSARVSDLGFMNNTAPTSTVFSVGDSYSINNNTKPYVAYCFSEVAGYSKFGSYTGNGSNDGVFVYCGFKPAWVMVKRTSSTGSWYIGDNTRNTYNVMNARLLADSSNAESSTLDFWDFTSNGFKLRTSSSEYNSSGQTFVFMAFAEHPFKYANAR